MQAGPNYIYIIFAIGYVIYSIVKAAKKVTANRPTIDNKPEQSQTVKPPTSTPVSDTGEDMRKMFEELMGVPKEEKIPTSPPTPLPRERGAESPGPRHPQPVPHHVEHAKVVSHAFDKAKAQAKTEKPVAEKPKIIPKKAPAEPIIEQEAAPDFDIRQAIIFSEILKRPEY